MIRRMRRVVAGVAVVATCPLLGCSARQQQIPPMPLLPEVRYVPPCDPDATIALTAAGEAALVQRDQALRSHLARLEALLRGED
jgi:hypothetical protein